jgi:hypothetical protein
MSISFLLHNDPHQYQDPQPLPRSYQQGNVVGLNEEGDLLDTSQEIRFMKVSDIDEIKLPISLCPRRKKYMDILYDQEQPPSSNRHHNTCSVLFIDYMGSSGRWLRSTGVYARVGV